MQFESIARAIEQISGSIDDTHKLSHNDRQRRESGGLVTSLIYGEMQLVPFMELLGEVVLQIPRGERIRIVDIGSGRGRLVISAAVVLEMLNRASTVVGIELLESLVDEAREIHAKANAKFAFKRAEIQWISKDALNCVEDWKDANILVSCCTCFDEVLLNQIFRLAQKNLKIGAFFITTSHRILEGVKNQRTMAGFKLVKEIRGFEMSWGTATVYVYQRIAVSKIEQSVLKNLFN
jgi:SAM-dependent methyltransferase